MTVGLSLGGGDLSKGVVALNTNRSVYRLNQTAYLQFGVVDGEGRTICDAELELSVTAPSGGVENLSTRNGRINRNPECGPDNVIDAPDYFAVYTPRSTGAYDVRLIARTSDVVHERRDRFEVRDEVPLDVERIGPTRIYPVADYTMTLRVKANETYQGALRELVPASFDIRDHRLRLKTAGSSLFQPLERAFSMDATRERSVLTWEDIALESGDELEVTYTFNAPNTSPEFYVLGRAELTDFTEVRRWQIAVDATVVFDTFTEVVDTPITAHTPDTGTSWALAYDGTTAGTPAEVSETTDIFHATHIENNAGQAYTAQPAPSTTDQNVSITIKSLDTTTNDRPAGIFARRTDNSNFYHVQLLPNAHASSSVALYKFAGGTPTVLGTFDTTLGAGTVIKLEVRDATKKVFIDGVERISSADNSLTAPGTWGVYFGDFNGAGIGGDIRGTWHLDDFLAEDGDLAAADPDPCCLMTPVGNAVDQAFDMVVQPDGRFILVGHSENGVDEDVALVRYHPDGRQDLSFDGDGIRTDDIGTSNDRARAVALQPDGKIVFAGFTDDLGNDDFLVGRYDADGTLDASFAGGTVTTTLSGFQDRAAAVTIQPDGKIVAAGFANTGNGDVAVLRYNTDGSLDTSFDTDGIVITDVDNTDRVNDVKIQPDGKIVVGGNTNIAGDKAFMVIRYNSDGSLDTSFDTDGIVTTQISANADNGEAVVLYPDGKIALGGFYFDGVDEDFVVVRYNSNGSLDNSFDGDGIVITDFSGNDDNIDDLLLQPDGKILASGYAHNGVDQDYGVVRYNLDGSLDNTFGVGGRVTEAIGTLNDNSEASALLPDGSFIVAGFSDNGTNFDFSWTKHNPDGSLAGGCGVVNYRSIGTAANYTDGTGVTAANGSTVVTGIPAATWRSSNRGRGDLITIGGVPYTVLSVDSETQLTLTSPYTEATGSGKAYTIARKFATLQAWEDCIDSTTVVLPACHDVYTADFISDKRSEVGIAYNDSVVPANADFTAPVLIDGSTTDANHDITLTADDGNRHYGLQTQGVLIDNGASGSDTIGIEDDYVTVEWLEVFKGGGGSDGLQIQNQSVANHIVIRNMLVHDTGSSGISVSSGLATVDAYNNFVFQTGSRGMAVFANPTSTIRFLNNTVYGNSFHGVSFPNAGLYPNVLLQNNISHSNSTDFVVAGPNPASSNNLSGDDPALNHSPGGGGVDTPLLANVGFVDPFTANAEDFHIQAGVGTAWEAGADLSALLTTDIDDGPRPSGPLWDIGADETGAAASSLLLANHPSGQVTNKFSGASPITDTWFQFLLTRSGTVTVDTVRVTFTTFVGVANGDVTNGELWEDTNGNGTWDDSGGGDTLIEGSLAPSGGVLTFTTNFTPGAGGTNYFVRATISNLSAGDATVFSLDTAGIDEVEAGASESGSAANAFHSQGGSPTINYRSIGTNTSVLYQAGTATVSAGSNVVTFGGGASLPIPTATGAVGQGDRLVIGSETFFILSRLSATQVSVQQPAVSDHAGDAYTVTRAYNTLQAWEDDCVAVPGCLPTSSGGRGGDLVTDDRHEVGVAYNDSPFTTGASISGSTTDATHYLHLTVSLGQRHSGIAGTGAVLDGVDTDQGLRLSDDYTVVEWFEFTRNRGVGSAAALVVQSANNVLIQNVIIHDFFDPGNLVSGIRAQSNAGYTVRNCIVYDGGRAGIRNNAPSATGLVENCTVYGMADPATGAGVLQTAGTLTVTNTVSMGNQVDFSGTIAQSYNMSSDATANCGATCLPSENATLQFVNIAVGDEANWNFHLKAGANAIDAADPTPLAFCCDIDGATRIGTWDIGADEGGAAGCCELHVSEGAGTITVTSPDKFELRFNEATGGGIDEFFDLAEDPVRTTDLAGGPSEQLVLFDEQIEDSGNFYYPGSNPDARLHLLEVTPTRVKVRQDTAYHEYLGVVGELGGVHGFGDHTIFPSGKMALRWNRKTTTAVNYDSLELNLTVHSAAGPPLNGWAGYSESGPLAAYPGLGPAATDDFLMFQIDAAGARNDFLAILYSDWVGVHGAEGAFVGTPIPTYTEAGWIRTTSGVLAAGAGPYSQQTGEVWNFLNYLKPTNFLNEADVNVTGRVDDYRPRTACATCGPDDLATPAAPTAGGGWFHASENTSGPSDFFNEAESVYALEFDMAAGLTFDLDGGLGTPGTPVRYTPFFKIREWRSLSDPTVTLEGTALGQTDFKADVKPLSRAHAAQDLIWYSTLQQTPFVTTPDVGSAGSIQGTPSYVAARYGQGARFDSTGGDAITFPGTGMDVTRGTVEFWVQPEFDHTDAIRHVFWYNRGSGGDFMQIEKTAANELAFSVSNGAVTSVTISSANYGWRDRDWVHIRASWNEGSSPGDQLRLYVNGSEPPHTDAGTYTSAGMTVGTNYIGNHSGGSFPAVAVIDEFVLYDSSFQPATRGYAGLMSSPSEYMASTARNLQLELYPADGAGRTDYYYFGADSQFRGLNVMLATAGVGTPFLEWEYWDGANGAWADLDALGTFVDETSSLTEVAGTVYWDEDPAGWQPYSVAGGPDLFYVRLHASTGSSYTTFPTEALIKTDILLFQYCGDITEAAQTFSFAVPTPTAVELLSFEAIGVDEAIELAWVTGSEIDNLGFHLYRASSASGPYERITSVPIPSLGSSPEGKHYSYTDSDLTNGVTYYYKLEDIETTGKTELHGPVRATPRHADDAEGDEPPGDDTTPPPAAHAYGQPDRNRLNIVSRGNNELVLELVTEGFYAETQDDGSVRLHIPGFELLTEISGAGIPVKRTWIDARAGRKVTLVSVEARGVDAYPGLRPAGAETPEIVTTRNGTIRAARRKAKRAFRGGESLVPSAAARIVSVGFQSDQKKALVELAPLRWDASRGQLLLARRLVVRVSLREPEPGERVLAGGARGRGYQRRRSHARRAVVARLGTTHGGLHRVGYEEVMRGRRGVAAKALRLSRQGEPVAFHLEPNANRFEPGSSLYFVSDGARANPYGSEAVYELEVGVRGEAMAEVSAAPSGAVQPVYWHRAEWEEDRYYQSALVDAPDLWLWDLVFAPETKSYPLDVSALASNANEAARLSVWLQGASDFPANPDHHVRVYVNGTLVDELSWDGKQAKHLDVELAPGVLVEGDNVLELENVGDTEASYSMVMLDRYAVAYPRLAQASDGRIEGRWSGFGTAEVSGLTAGTHVLDVSEEAPRWLVDTELGGDGRLRFSAEAGKSYLAVSAEAVHRPVLTRPVASRLKNEHNRADYVVIAPEGFLEAVTPLLEIRQSDGLRVKAVSLEEIYAEFGFGEPTPEAIKDFLSYAYHHWREPSLRYVVLLGDGTYDYKDNLGTGVTNQVPPRMVKTTYLWTSSDPSFAAVNGEDILPDVAIGRLPAATLEEARVLVEKIVAYETGEAGVHGAPVVLVADDPDGAGNFEADADALADGVLQERDVEKIYFSELGKAATRASILRAFDDGASLVSYLGHGGIHLWADENFFNANDVVSLNGQSQQPLLLTMNCLNGYFHFPYFDSLSEALVKAEEKGAIAAFSPSGLSLNGPAHRYHEAMLDELLSGNHERLGDAVLAAQADYAETGAFPELLSIYHLLGDPALKLK